HVPFFIHTAKFEQRGVFRIGSHGTLVPCIRQRDLLALDGVAQLARKNRRRFTRSRRPMRAWLWAWNLIPERRARVHVVATMRLLRKRLMHVCRILNLSVEHTRLNIGTKPPLRGRALINKGRQL